MHPRHMRLAAFVILLTALTVLLFLVTPLIWPAVQIFILAGLITLALDTVVQWQVARGIPRWAATLDLLLVLILAASLLLYFIVPPLIMQFQQFVAVSPSLWTQATGLFGALLRRYPQLSGTFDITRFLSGFFMGAESWVQAARSVFTTAIGAVTASVLILVIVLYTLLNPWPLLFGLRGLFPRHWWGTIDHLAHAIADRIRGWVLGTLLLAVIVGGLDYLGLLLINLFYGPNLPFILLFSIIGALLEVIPVVGPIIATILPTLVGLSIDPVLGLLVLGLFTLIQQLESNVIVPIVMEKVVQMHPVSLLFALVVLSALFGLFGAIVAVPVASVLKVLYDEWYYPLLHDGRHPSPPPRETVPPPPPSPES